MIVDRPLSWKVFFVFATLFSIQVFSQIVRYSMVTDEPAEISDGYFYWGGDTLSDACHPPLAKGLQSLPSRLLGLKTSIPPEFSNFGDRAYYFLFTLNRDPLRRILLGARSVSFLFGLALGWLLFLATREDRMWSAAAMVFWAFEPNLSAFSSLAYSDVPVTTLCFWAVFMHHKTMDDHSSLSAFSVGFLVGAASCAKFTALAIFPWLVVLEFWSCRIFYLSGRGSFRAVSRLFVGVLGFAVAVGLVYLPGTVALPGHPLPWVGYLHGIQVALTNAAWPGYLFGNLQAANLPHYYLTALVLKTSCVFLLMLIGAFCGRWLFRKGPPLWIWGPGVWMIAAVSWKVHNTGLRHALPAMPFLILAASWTVAETWKKTDRSHKREVGLALAGLGLIYVAGSLVSFPNELTYFNECVPRSKKAYLLGDANLDIGQETRQFFDFARSRGWTNLKVASFGGVPDYVYGYSAEPWTRLNAEKPEPGWVYAMNLGYAQLGRVFDKDGPLILDGWVRHIPPTGRMGETWFYWEFPPNRVVKPSRKNVSK